MMKRGKNRWRLWRTVLGQGSREAQVIAPATEERVRSTEVPAPEIAPNDPILAYFQNVAGIVDVEKLELDSPALREMKSAGVKMAIPLVSQGELIGVLNLGPRMSQQEYSADDRKLLADLASQTAPAVRLAQLVRQQQAEAQERERIEQELRIARLIQQTLLPKVVPQLEGWSIAAHYQPAREVGGDFYDFMELEDGRLGIVVGDVTDKGVPAALVMATTRTILRSAAQRFDSPGEVLQRANDVLYPDIPPNMFVTCLYAILDPESGVLRYANAGHDLPYRRYEEGAQELRARGMPLGLMPGMAYEEKEVLLDHGDSVLFYSDGLVEAHNPEREMFGFPHLQALIGDHGANSEGTLVEFLLNELAKFTGEGWEQEDDITLVTLQRSEGVMSVDGPAVSSSEEAGGGENWRTLERLSVPSEPGNEREAMEKVAEVAKQAGLDPGRMEKLKTAVAEATMNAMEHGNKYRAEVPVVIEVLSSGKALSVRITDQGGSPVPKSEVPDLEAKLEGLQTPRGWGLFLIESMVDEMNVASDEKHHTVELVLYLKGEGDAS